MAKKPAFAFGGLMGADSAPEIEGVTLRSIEETPAPAPAAAPIEEPEPEAKPASVKRARGAPKRAFRGEDARRLSIELDAETYAELQILGVLRKEKLQSMGERAILDYLRKHKRS